MAKQSPTPKRKRPARQKSSAAPAARSTKQATEAPKPKREIPIVGIAFGLIAAGLVAAVLLTGNTGPGNEAGEPTYEGEWLPFFESTQGDPGVGLEAPQITGADYEGNEVKVEPNGTPTAVVFLAHWCQFCQAEVPKVQSWLDGGGGVEGVDIVSVTTAISSARENFPPSAWLEREGWTSPVIKDDLDNTLHNAFGAGGFPFWVFLNGDGTVAVRNSGQLDITTLQEIMLTLE